MIDDPVVVIGDGFADINLHGGPWVVRQCLNLAERAGFETGKCDDGLIEAASAIEQEILQSLSHARTEQGIRILLDQTRRWRDFVNQPANDRIRSMLDDRSLWWLLHPPRVAIVGVANVGKSTLANRLFGQELSITADIPGTTRDWVGDWANLDGLPIMLLDTPGQRVSNDTIEQIAIQRSRPEIESADLVLVVLDPTVPLEEQNHVRKRFSDGLIVINKMDMPSRWDTSSLDAVRTVAVKDQGINELRSRIRKYFGCANEMNGPFWWTDRQREILERALANPEALREIFDEG